MAYIRKKAPFNKEMTYDVVRSTQSQHIAWYLCECGYGFAD